MNTYYLESSPADQDDHASIEEVIIYIMAKEQIVQRLYDI